MSKKIDYIKEIGTDKYDADIDIEVESENDNGLIYLGKEYKIKINLKINDEKKRPRLLDTFSMYLHINKLDISSYDCYRKFSFNNLPEANTELSFIANELNQLKLELTFLQNTKIFCCEEIDVTVVKKPKIA